MRQSAAPAGSLAIRTEGLVKTFGAFRALNGLDPHVATGEVRTLDALAVAAVGAAPSKRVVGWMGIVATFGLTILGPTFKLPDWAMAASRLRHVPNMLAPTDDWTGLRWIAGAIAVLLTVGFIGYRRRDII
jgi:ABC-2 type transport system permease protein